MLNKAEDFQDTYMWTRKGNNFFERVLKRDSNL